MNNGLSRTARSARNAAVSILAQILIIGLGFATRTVFIMTLGVELLGVNSVLTSVLALLAFADLGINGAVMYALYTPLKEGDKKKVASIVNYAGILFRVVAFLVAIIGLLLTPFISQIVRLDGEVEYLELYYLIFLTNTVFSYLMLNRLILLDADQRIFITKSYSMVFDIFRSVVQILCLVFVGSFVLFLAVQVFATVSKNLTVYLKAGRIYPYIREPAPKMGKSERVSLHQSVRAMMVFRIGGLVLNHSPALLISALIGTLALGYFSNYMLVVSSVVMITEVIFSALTPSVGNLVADGNRRASRRTFNELVLLSLLIHGLASVAILVLMEDFITVWLGSEFLLSFEVLLAIVFNFYVTGTMMPLWSFRSATGLFRQTQWLMIFTAVVSLFLSFILGSYFGLVGIVVAPAVSRLVTGGWYEPWLLIRKHLSGKIWKYFGFHICVFLGWCGAALSILWIASLVPNIYFISVGVKLVLLALVLPLVVWFLFRRNPSFRSLLARLSGLIRGFKSSRRSL